MDFFLMPCVIFVLIGILIGYYTPKHDWAVQTLLCLVLITILSFVVSFIFSDVWFYTLMFACISVPGVVIIIIQSHFEKKKTKEKEDSEKKERERLLREYDLLEIRNKIPLKKINDNSYYIGDKCIGLSARKGYNKYSIAGAYYQNLPMSLLGKFNGYVELEPYNDHDKLAIAVYNDAGIQLGYLPRGNRKLHSYITNEGGQVHAYGYIACHDDNSMYGEVCVETDKSLVTKRNKPYATN